MIPSLGQAPWEAEELEGLDQLTGGADVDAVGSRA